MSRSASPVTTTGARLLALLVMLSVALLWQPKGIERSDRGQPGMGLPGAQATQATQDKGTAPRGAILTKRHVDDRAPGLPPMLAEPALLQAAFGGAPRRAEGFAQTGLCAPAATCGHRTARAPPPARA